MKQILLIADVRNWAFDNVAQYLQKILAQDYYVTIIYTEEFDNPSALLKKISQLQKIDFIHIFYRRYLRYIIEHIAFNKISNAILSNFFSIPISTSIPDHLFIENAVDISKYKDVLSFADNYYTTSAKLFAIYSKIPSYPKPWQEVIFDNVIAQYNKPHFDNNDIITITWIGNSKWGKGSIDKHEDAKGYYTVAMPAIESLQKKIKIKLLIANSQEKKRSKKEVYDILQQSDILLITSSIEGTPLTLIEAMSCGCAVVTTDIGIASEVLPQPQQAFIVDKDPNAFVSAVLKLNVDRQLLSALKKANYESFQKIFLNDDFFRSKWTKLIEGTIAECQNNEYIKRKQKIITLIKSKIGITQRLTFFVLNNKFINSVARFLLRFKIGQFIVRQVYFFLKNIFTRDNFIAQFNANIQQIKDSDLDYIVLYPSIFNGVKNSTNVLFQNTLDVVNSLFHEYLGLPKCMILKKVRAILSTKKRNIIISGGGKILSQILDVLIKERNAYDLNIIYLWHGSPAQWTDYHHLDLFNQMYLHCVSGHISTIVTLKKDLEIVLDSMGIKAYLLQNFVPNNHVASYRVNKKFTIGMWSAYVNWVKNLFPQLVAVNTLGKDFAFITNYHFDQRTEVLVRNVNVQVLEPYLPHKKLIAEIAKTDLTLYVTNTECSPMIALESLSVRVPCLVGPTSGLYDSDDYLKDLLTVNRVDCSFAIASAIKRVQSNIDEIKQRIPQFVKQYNSNALVLRENFLSDMRKSSFIKD